MSGLFVRIQDYITPKGFCGSVFQLNLDDLRRIGIRGLVVDLDNTLVAWNERTANPSLVAWFAGLHVAGFRCCIVSNNVRDPETERFASDVGAALVTSAGKPFPRGLTRAMQVMGTSPSETAVIGDQLFTDVLGGNILGAYTILVRPVARKEFPGTRLSRLLEKAALKVFPKLRALTGQGEE